MIGAVNRHPDVVKQSPGGDDDLGVAVPHRVVGDHRGPLSALDQQAQQTQGDVEDDLDVDPGVVGHPEALRLDLCHVPPGPHLGVGVDPLEQRLEPAVAARRGTHPRRGDRLARRAPELPGPGRLGGLGRLLLGF